VRLMNRAAPRRPDSRPSGPPPAPGEDGDGRSGEEGEDGSPDRCGEVDAMASRTLTLAFSPFPLLAGVCRDFDSGLDVWFDFCGALVSSAIGKGRFCRPGCSDIQGHCSTLPKWLNQSLGFLVRLIGRFIRPGLNCP
jgi:hypothetical protein